MNKKGIFTINFDTGKSFYLCYDSFLLPLNSWLNEGTCHKENFIQIELQKNIASFSVKSFSSRFLQRRALSIFISCCLGLRNFFDHSTCNSLINSNILSKQLNRIYIKRNLLLIELLRSFKLFVYLNYFKD